MILWVGNSGASVAFQVVFIIFLYGISVDTWTYCLKPMKITPRLDVEAGNNKLTHNIHSRKLGVLSEREFILCWRSEQIMNTIFNESFSTLLLSFHHMLCLVIFVGSTFIIIRMPDKILEGGVIMLLVFIVGSLLLLYIVYFEASRFGLVVDTSSDLIGAVRSQSLRRTALYKTFISCKSMDVKLAYPFYRISKETFSEFFDQGVNFIFTLLTM